MLSGFYKLHDGVLLFNSQCVLAPGVFIEREHYEIYKYPIDGWFWFNSQEEANAFFKLTEDE